MEDTIVTKVSFDDLQIMATFEKITHSKIEEYINGGESLYFIVTTGNFRALLRKDGSNIKRMENAIGKKIKVFRHSKDLKEFIQNLTLQAATDINIDESTKTVEITIPNEKKAVLIG